MKNIDDRIYTRLVGLGRRRFPDMKIKFKDESKLHTFIGEKLAFWLWSEDENGDRVHRYLTSYTSVLGKTVWFPNREYINSSVAWVVLAHELVHMRDRYRIPFKLFDAGYVLPQALAVLALGALGAFWYLPLLWCLLALLFLAPIPSPIRAWAEFRGYTMSMAVNYWRYGRISPSYLYFVERKFTGPDYLFMWPFNLWVRRRLQIEKERIESGEILEDPLFRDVHDIIEDEMSRSA